ncbi:PREDICTED: tRNA (uracil-5-)-methyltransferase homolog A-like isoform X2 [Priapulus caudatus]|uniref:tRNA (uracil(54)-C(5))-methyltransferase n=1 Tax=Priapulus caudatus TaxID=37621 RepID=A0ABM1DTR6_PRICU|nr:PREDICTED: tRNA (uracil-5-)-methyltransferase homolog A-like isoform X2 [Priapulus caudatus]
MNEDKDSQVALGRPEAESSITIRPPDIVAQSQCIMVGAKEEEDKTNILDVKKEDYTSEAKMGEGQEDKDEEKAHAIVADTEAEGNQATLGCVNEEDEAMEAITREGNMADGDTDNCEKNTSTYVDGRAGLFTSEIYKIEIQNLPKYFGHSQLKKRITNQGLKPVKVKSMRATGPSYCFVTFRCEEDRQEAIKKLNGHVWKGCTFRVKIANAKVDPIVKRRQEDTNDDGGNQSVKRQRVTTNKGGHTQGKRAEVDESSSLEDQVKERLTPLWNTPYEEQLEVKQRSIVSFLTTFARSMSDVDNSQHRWIQAQRKANNNMCCKLEDIRPSPRIEGSRNKLSFSCGLRPDTRVRTVGFRVGRYEAGSTGVVEPYGIDVVPDYVKNVVRVIEQYVRASTYEVFDSQTHSGYWESVLCRTTESKEVMLGFCMRRQTLTDSETQQEMAALKEFFTTGPGAAVNVTSLYITFTIRKQTGSSSDLQWQHIMGEKAITERLLGLGFRISPSSFFQVNTLATEVLYSVVGDVCKLNEDTVLLDICCGTGTIGQTLAKQVKKVYGFELIQEAVDDARYNAKVNGISNIEYICGDAMQEVPELVGKLSPYYCKDVVAILDPPRAGCSVKVIQAIRRCKQINRLIYVSCNAQLAKHNFLDLVRPASNKFRGEPFRPIVATPVDLFPHTNHVELVLLFERGSHQPVSDASSVNAHDTDADAATNVENIDGAGVVATSVPAVASAAAAAAAAPVNAEGGSTDVKPRDVTPDKEVRTLPQCTSDSTMDDVDSTPAGNVDGATTASTGGSTTDDVARTTTGNADGATTASTGGSTTDDVASKTTGNVEGATNDSQ